jgi:hypothetical protein
MPQYTVFLLSPARCDGRRAQVLLNPSATFDVAARVRSAEGAPIGEVFSFLSGLYFRGKLAYARAFGRRPHGAASSFIITTDRGLVSPDLMIRRDDLVRFTNVDIAATNERFIKPLRAAAERLAEEVSDDTRVVLLGSIATGKYVDVLTSVFGDRLLFPGDFVGRGDMSRGGLLLRCVNDDRELAYQPVVGAVRHGKRPPKLEKLRRHPL